MLIVKMLAFTSCPGLTALRSMADLCRLSANGQTVSPVKYDLVAALEVQEFLTRVLASAMRHRLHRHDGQDDLLKVAHRALEEISDQKLSNREVVIALHGIVSTFVQIKPRWQPNNADTEKSLRHLADFLIQLQEALERELS